MIEPFKMSYTVLGGLGIFILGMKYLSDSLQMLSGRLIRKAISSLTTNRILAVLVGLIVTAFVQSSSITTVMVVGFTNAGLMQLSQAIGVILGANIGTTATGWILAVNIGKYGLLLIALGICREALRTAPYTLLNICHREDIEPPWSGKSLKIAVF